MQQKQPTQPKQVLHNASVVQMKNLVACNAFPAAEPLTVEQILDTPDAASPPWRGSSMARQWFSHFGAERFAKHSDLCCGAQ